MKQKVVEILTRAEKDLLEAQCSPYYPTGIRDRAIIAFLRSTGCRVQELIDVEEQDLRPAERMVKVCGKGSKERLVSIDHESWKKIQTWLKKKHEIFKKHKRKPPNLFCTIRKGKTGASSTAIRAGRPMNEPIIFRMLQRRAKKAGLAKRTYPHLFRHSRAVELLHAGVNVKAIQRFLGHTNLQVTSIYLEGLNGEEAMKEIAEIPS